MFDETKRHKVKKYFCKTFSKGAFILSLQPAMYVTQFPHPVEDSCSICHEEMNSGPIAGHHVSFLSHDSNSSLEQNIYHVFHKFCLDQWIQSHSSASCPLCRMPIIHISPQLEDLYVLIGIGRLEDIETFLSEQMIASEDLEKALNKALQYKKTDIALYFLQNCQMSQAFLDQLLHRSIEQSLFAIAQCIIKTTAISKEARQMCILQICQMQSLCYPENIYMKMLRHLLKTGPIDQDIKDKAVNTALENKHTNFANILLQ